MLRNPITIRCPNKSCGALAGAPCLTPGRFINAAPHMPRLRSAIGVVVKDADRAAAIAAYLATTLEQLLGRLATEEEIGRASREGSLKTKTGWLADLINERAPRRAMPSIRRNGDETTYWGAVVREIQVSEHAWILELDTGHKVAMVSNEAWQWETWWPVRKAEAIEFLGAKVKPRYRFTVNKGQLTAIDFEAWESKRHASPSKPVAPHQIGLDL